MLPDNAIADSPNLIINACTICSDFTKLDFNDDDVLVTMYSYEMLLLLWLSYLYPQ